MFTVISRSKWEVEEEEREIKLNQRGDSGSMENLKVEGTELEMD